MVVVFGLPMFLSPVRWAQALRWPIPADERLVVYYGRCLASLIVVLSGAAFVAARTPALQPFYFDLLTASTGLMVGVHAWGALRRIQPATETWEIGFWVALLVLALLFHPGRG